MPDIDVKETFLTARQKGLMAAVGVVVTGVAIGVVDQFTGRIVPRLTTAIEHIFSPPNFVLQFSEPTEVDSDGIAVREISADPAGHAPTPFHRESARLVIVSAAPGNYILLIRRTVNGAAEELRQPVSVKESGETLAIDTSQQNWVSAAALAQGGEAPVGTPAPAASAWLVGTRWATTPDDFAAVPAVANRTARSALAIALAEVGTYENGAAEDKARVAAYWTALPDWGGPTDMPWGATFLSWVMVRAGASAPASAAFAEWRKWVDAAPDSHVAPGMVAVFQRPAGGAARYLAGIVVQVRPDCTEIVAGNIADRVVVTCVTQAPLAARWP